MIEIILTKTSALLQLPERTYGTIKRIGMLNNEPILYGDINAVKPGSLYYIPGVKQVYRYIKPIFRKAQNSGQSTSIGGVQIGGGSLPGPGGHPQVPTATEEYHFTTIEQTSTDSLMIPEEERGTIRNAGYLFNEIIYSGDPNLVSNGSLFYHDTLPYISIVSNVDGIINLSTKELNQNNKVTTVVTEYRVSPQSQHDYSKDYLTFEALEEGTFTLTVPANVDSTKMTSVSYSTDNGETWTTTNVDNTAQTITTPTITQGNKVLWKGVGKQMAKSTSVYSCFSSTGNFNVGGNIMSLLYGDEFANQVTFPSGSTCNFTHLFRNNDKLISAENLTLPATTSVSNCYYSMFFNCASLATAPTILPATTLADSCYANMFNGTSITESPILPALNTVDGCYSYMFNKCSNLSKITAYFITDPAMMFFTENWVNGVAENGTFVKNSAATWDETGDYGVPQLWTIQTVDVPSNEITI